MKDDLDHAEWFAGFLARQDARRRAIAREHRDRVMWRLGAALRAVLPGASSDQIDELLSALLAAMREDWT